MEARFFLNDLIGKSSLKCTMPVYKVKSLDEVEEAAKSLRTQWSMDNWPIDSITNLLEENPFH